MAPLATFGFLAIDRSQHTAIGEVREGNGRLAQVIGGRIADHLDNEARLLQSIGTAALSTPEPDKAEALLLAYHLRHPHLRDLAVFRRDPATGPAAVGQVARREYQALVARAMQGQRARTDIRPADASRPDAFAHTMVVAEPVVVAGRLEGVICAEIDLIGVWEPINAVRVGETGFVRLLSADGQLLAHGDPEERRYVFHSDRSRDAALLARALTGAQAANQGGQQVVASVAAVPGSAWLVVVEQDVREAFAGARALRATLGLFALGALVVVLVAGITLGRQVVRGLEQLRQHTAVLARGELTARAAPRSRLVEVQTLAGALNEMAASLARLQEQARARERLTTFARVAAGLAHDLRHPVEAIRAAFDALTQQPEQPAARAHVEAVARRDVPALRQIVDDLQGLARTGDMKLHRQAVDVSALAREILQDLRLAPRYRGVQFSAEGTAGAVQADRNLLRRAVINLATNAADACLGKGPGGSVTIQLADAMADGMIEIRVVDTGCGIPEERLADVLHADFKSTKRTSGVGLGLGVVRQVAESHGGNLTVASRLGVGSTFTLALPRPAEERRSEVGQPGGGEDVSHGRTSGVGAFVG
jgi:signal transduction histidine kinase